MFMVNWVSLTVPVPVPVILGLLHRKLDSDVATTALDFRRRAALSALLIGVSLVAVHIFLRDALLEGHRDLHAHHFRDGGVFVVAGFHVLRLGG